MDVVSGAQGNRDHRADAPGEKRTNAGKHTGEQGHLEIDAKSENIKVTYTVDPERKEIPKGMMGAITGAGLGGILGNVLRKDETWGCYYRCDRACSWWGTYGINDGCEESKDNRTNFSAVLAETIKEVEDELQYIILGEAEVKETIRESSRQKFEDTSVRAEKYRGMLEDLFGQEFALQEEIDMPKCEGVNIAKAMGQIDQADSL